MTGDLWDTETDARPETLTSLLPSILSLSPSIKLIQVIQVSPISPEMCSLEQTKDTWTRLTCGKRKCDECGFLLSHTKRSTHVSHHSHFIWIHTVNGPSHRWWVCNMFYRRWCDLCALFYFWNVLKSLSVTHIQCILSSNMSIFNDPWLH